MYFLLKIFFLIFISLFPISSKQSGMVINKTKNFQTIKAFVKDRF